MNPCDPHCAFCARDFWRWLKHRQSAMRAVRKGDGESFDSAMASSNVVGRPPSVMLRLGDKVEDIDGVLYIKRV